VSAYYLTETAAANLHPSVHPFYRGCWANRPDGS